MTNNKFENRDMVIEREIQPIIAQLEKMCGVTPKLYEKEVHDGVFLGFKIDLKKKEIEITARTPYEVDDAKNLRRFSESWGVDYFDFNRMLFSDKYKSKEEMLGEVIEYLKTL